MKNVKCADCAEYKNEWCERKMDSPYPDMLRDCEYYHDIDKDVVKVVRCKDCKYCITHEKILFCEYMGNIGDWRFRTETDFCSRGERREK